MQHNDQISSRGSRWGSHVVRQVKHRPTARGIAEKAIDLLIYAHTAGLLQKKVPSTEKFGGMVELRAVTGCFARRSMSFPI
jgi:hypothetical protein